MILLIGTVDLVFCVNKIFFLSHFSLSFTFTFPFPFLSFLQKNRNGDQEDARGKTAKEARQQKGGSSS